MLRPVTFLTSLVNRLSISPAILEWAEDVSLLGCSELTVTYVLSPRFRLLVGDYCPCVLHVFHGHIRLLHVDT